MTGRIHKVKASSFADPADVAAYYKWYHIYLSEGMTPAAAAEHALAKGDNAVGCWGDSTAQGSGPCCAIPPEEMVIEWGGTTPDKARLKKVLVTIGSHSTVCLVKDRMPHEANIRNGAGIDLSPDTVSALGQKSPLMESATWKAI